jgi:hypothetical protein
MVGLVLHEGTGGMVAMLVWLFVGHALVYSLLIWGGAALLARTLLGRFDARGRRSLVIVATILLLLGGSVAPLYRTQFHHSSARARLLELYR